MGRIRRRKIRYSARRHITMSAIRKHNRRRRRSQIEIQVADWLIEDEIKFQKEKPIGKCHVDIFIPPRTIIELNGCYWHCCEQCYRLPSDKQKQYRIRDVKRHSFLKSKGFDLIVIWEHEIKNEPRRVRAQLRALNGLYDRDKVK